MYIEQENICGGLKCKVEGKHAVSMGYMTAATKDNAVSVGSFTSAIHKNSTVLGNNLTSKRDNSTLFNQAELTEDGLHMNGGAIFLSDVKCGDKPVPYRCTACNDPICYGVKWIKDGYIVDDGVKTFDADMGLCFDCILECVLEFKARMRWDRDKEGFK